MSWPLIFSHFGLKTAHKKGCKWMKCVNPGFNYAYTLELWAKTFKYRKIYLSFYYERSMMRF